MLLAIFITVFFIVAFLWICRAPFAEELLEYVLVGTSLVRLAAISYVMLQQLVDGPA